MTMLGRIFHTGCERETSGGPAAGGLVVGAAVGAAATVMVLGMPNLLTGDVGMFVATFVMFPTAFAVWIAGAALAAPGWFVLHSLGARCQQAAMIYGAVLTGAVTVAGLLLLSGAHYPWQQFAMTFAAMTLVGAMVGWIVASIAYTSVES